MRALLSNEVSGVTFIFVANKFHQFRVRHDSIGDGNGPGFCVRLRLLNSDVDKQSTVVRPIESFGHFRRVGQRATLDVEPDIVPEAGSLHNQCVILPVSN